MTHSYDRSEVAIMGRAFLQVLGSFQIWINHCEFMWIQGYKLPYLREDMRFVKWKAGLRSQRVVDCLAEV